MSSPPVTPPPQASNPQATSALVLGLCASAIGPIFLFASQTALVFTSSAGAYTRFVGGATVLDETIIFILGLLTIVFGVLGWQNARRTGQGRVMSAIALTLGILAVSSALINVLAEVYVQVLFHAVRG